MTVNSSNEIDDKSNLRGYLFFWIGQLVSIFGSSVVQFVIAWWLTVRTESALVLSLANVAGFLPIILFSPLAGVIVATPLIGPTSILIGMAIFGVGAAGGSYYFLGPVVEGETGQSFTRPLLIEANSPEFKALNCEEILTLS